MWLYSVKLQYRILAIVGVVSYGVWPHCVQLDGVWLQQVWLSDLSCVSLPVEAS